MDSTTAAAPLPQVTLFHFKGAWGLFDVCPFCTEVEAYLLLAEIPFTAVRLSVYDLQKVPNGRVPLIEHEGKQVSEAQAILEHLQAASDIGLDAALSPLQRAHGRAFRTMLAESLYWAIIQSRWFEPTVWTQYRRLLYDELSPEHRDVVPGMAAEAVRREMLGHGMGRHPPERIYQIALGHLGAVSEQLSAGPFLLGEHVSSFDAAAYAFLSHVLSVPYATPLKQSARQLPNLEAYLARMKQLLATCTGSAGDGKKHE